MKLVGLSGSPTERSKTLLAIEVAVEHVADAYPSVETEIVNVRDYDVQFCDGRDPAKYEGDTRRVIDKIVEADALIVGTPMYRATYTGILKNVFDLIPNDALHGKPVGIVATGGSDHHFLAIEHELKPLIGFFQGLALPGGVYAKNEDYENGALVSEGVIRSLRQLAGSVVEFAERPTDRLVGSAGPTIRRESLSRKE